MNSTRQDNRSQSVRRAVTGAACPSCAAGLAADADLCPACGFVGADSMVMFSESPPPLMPLLDAAGLWSAEEIKKIEAAREKLRWRFPQFHFHVWTVMLPPETKLPVFGFWLLNVCPYYVGETATDRAWTVLLLVDARSGHAAVVPGYRAEPWLGDDDWSKVLDSMTPRWKAGKSVAAVVRFFETSGSFLDQAWKFRGLHRSKSSR